jgi:hypothetical protein
MHECTLDEKANLGRRRGKRDLAWVAVAASRERHSVSGRTLRLSLVTSASLLRHKAYGEKS